MVVLILQLLTPYVANAVDLRTPLPHFYKSCSYGGTIGAQISDPKVMAELGRALYTTSPENFEYEPRSNFETGVLGTPEFVCREFAESQRRSLNILFKHGRSFGALRNFRADFVTAAKYHFEGNHWVHEVGHALVAIRFRDRPDSPEKTIWIDPQTLAGLKQMGRRTLGTQHLSIQKQGEKLGEFYASKFMTTQTQRGISVNFFPMDLDRDGCLNISANAERPKSEYGAGVLPPACGEFSADLKSCVAIQVYRSAAAAGVPIRSLLIGEPNSLEDIPNPGANRGE